MLDVDRRVMTYVHMRHWQAQYYCIINCKKYYFFSDPYWYCVLQYSLQNLPWHEKEFDTWSALPLKSWSTATCMSQKSHLHNLRDLVYIPSVMPRLPAMEVQSKALTMACCNQKQIEVQVAVLKHMSVHARLICDTVWSARHTVWNSTAQGQCLRCKPPIPYNIQKYLELLLSIRCEDFAQILHKFCTIASQTLLDSTCNTSMQACCHVQPYRKHQRFCQLMYLSAKAMTHLKAATNANKIRTHHPIKEWW